jgi:hypothetical protein
VVDHPAPRQRGPYDVGKTKLILYRLVAGVQPARTTEARGGLAGAVSQEWLARVSLDARRAVCHGRSQQRPTTVAGLGVQAFRGVHPLAGYYPPHPVSDDDTGSVGDLHVLILPLLRLIALAVCGYL